MSPLRDGGRKAPSTDRAITGVEARIVAAARAAARLPRRLSWRRLALGGAVAALVGSALLVGLALARSDLLAPPPSTLLVDRHGRFLGEHCADEGCGYWELDDVPERVARATIAIEDRRFAEHRGVDVRAIGRAALQNVRAGEVVSGASTLAMQVARMQRPGPRTLPRKAVEAATALALVARHGREAVLRHYLRIVPYGHRTHGIAHAARLYLDKPVRDLSWAEIAFLAAIPQAPSRTSPWDPRGRARGVARGTRILDLLREEGEIGDAEWTASRAEIRRLAVPARPERPEVALHALLRFTDADPSGPRRIETTLDLDLQGAATAATADMVEEWTSRGAGNAAVLVVDLEDLSVRAAVGSSDYFDDRRAGSIDYLRVPRSPGSTLKPFLFALAYRDGVLSPDRVLDDLGRGPGGIVNSDGRFHGPMLPRAALARSRNVPAATLLAEVGAERFWAFLGDLGLHDHRQPPDRYGLGLAIGGMPVSLERLVRATAVFGRGGRLAELRWRRDDPVGAPVGSQAAATSRAVAARSAPLPADVARLVSLQLSDPQARLPVFPRLGWLEYPFPVAVKTGTSSRWRDSWTLAWSDRFLVGVWVGHPDHRPMVGLSGYEAASRLARRVVLALHPERFDGFGDTAFPPPPGWDGVRLCALSGRPATPACDRVVSEWLPPSRPLRDPCPLHRRVAVDRRNGWLADDRTPPEHVEIRGVLDPPARLALWAAREGLPLAPPPRPSPEARRSGLSRVAEKPIRLAVESPADGLRLLVDPETPAGLSTVALRVDVDPLPTEVLWWVDDMPFALVGAPFEARWPIEAGEHVVQAEIPATGQRSRRVRVVVD